jgi:hypothetical protein
VSRVAKSVSRLTLTRPRHTKSVSILALGAFRLALPAFRLAPQAFGLTPRAFCEALRAFRLAPCAFDDGKGVSRDTSLAWEATRRVLILTKIPRATRKPSLSPRCSRLRSPSEAASQRGRLHTSAPSGVRPPPARTSARKGSPYSRPARRWGSTFRPRPGLSSPAGSRREGCTSWKCRRKGSAGSRHRR